MNKNKNETISENHTIDVTKQFTTNAKGVAINGKADGVKIDSTTTGEFHATRSLKVIGDQSVLIESGPHKVELANGMIKIISSGVVQVKGSRVKLNC